MSEKDQIYNKIIAFCKKEKLRVVVRKRSKGYSLYHEEDNFPIARLRRVGEDDRVDILWWSHRDKWEVIGEFGGVTLPLNEALNYILENPIGCFYQQLSASVLSSTFYG